MKKIIWKYNELPKLRATFKGKKTVLVGGCFSLLHYGHLVFLSAAKKLGDVLIVALESDEFIKKNKKGSLIHTQQQRAEILTSLSIVGAVVMLPYFDSHTRYDQLVASIAPSVIAVTKGDRQIENKKKQAASAGGKLHIVTPLIKGFSSSTIAKIL